MVFMLNMSRQFTEKIYMFALLLYFIVFFHVASLLSTGKDNEKVGVDNEKALELDNKTFFPYFSLI